MATIKLEDFQDTNRYRLLEHVRHKELMPFIMRYYRVQKSWLIRLHYAITGLPALAFVLTALIAQRSLVSIFAVVMMVVLTFVFLLPLHELLHALMYFIYGARSIRFSASLKGGYFYALAHNYPISSPAFIWTALAPTIFFGVPLLIIAIFLPDFRLWALGVLFVHNSAAMGDFALVNLFLLQRPARVWTYDNAKTRESFFYVENPPA